MRKVVYLLAFLIIPLIGGCEKEDLKEELGEDIVIVDEYLPPNCEICPEALDFEGIWIVIYYHNTVDIEDYVPDFIFWEIREGMCYDGVYPKLFSVEGDTIYLNETPYLIRNFSDWDFLDVRTPGGDLYILERYL